MVILLTTLQPITFHYSSHYTGANGLLTALSVASPASVCGDEDGLQSHATLH